MLADTEVQPPQAETIGVFLLFLGLTVVSWVLLWRYVRPAFRSQEGKADRMSRDRRLRRISWALLTSVYPVMFTVGCALFLFRPSGTAGAWTSIVFTYMIFGSVAAAVVLAVAALIFRTVDRHRARARHRALGLPDPPAPWWPSAVVTLWVIALLALFSVGTFITWKLTLDDLNRKGSLLESQLQLAMNDPSVQQLTQAGAPQGLIDAQLATLTGADTHFAEMKEQLHSVLTWNLAAFGAMAVVAMVGGVLLYRRQRRRRKAYDLHIAQTVNRAAQLAL